MEPFNIQENNTFGLGSQTSLPSLLGVKSRTSLEKIAWGSLIFGFKEF